MNTIFRTIFGSRLYKTDTPESDFDYKSIFIPSARDIVLQRTKAAINTQRPKGFGEKNFVGELDEEAYSLQKYLKLLAEGQTVALDVLFAPPYAVIGEPSPIWYEIVANKDKLVTKKASAFVGYCRQQASKYGVKGERLKAAREALEVLQLLLVGNARKTKLNEFEAVMIQYTERNPEYMEFLMIDQPNSDPINHWVVCGRKLPFNTSIGNAYEVIAKLVNDYGSRTIQAEKDGGVDWKALSHSIRIANQAIEFFKTGNITFPLPNVNHILDIKQGRLTYKEVGEEIESLLEEVEAASLNSVLPAEPDNQWIDDFVYKVYEKEVFDARKE